MGAIYFSHDEDARNDPKMARIRAKYGMEGYGCFFAILEMFSAESEHSLGYNEEEFEAIAYELRPSIDVREFIDKCIDVGLFVRDENRFWSESFVKRATEAESRIKKKSEAARKSVEGRWGKKRSEQQKQDEDQIEDKDWFRFVKTYEQNIGLFPHGGSKTGQVLESYYQDFGADMMCRAVEITNLKTPDNPVNFMLAILRNWANKGIKTVAEAEAMARSKERRQAAEQTKETQEPAIRGQFY